MRSEPMLHVLQLLREVPPELRSGCVQTPSVWRVPVHFDQMYMWTKLAMNIPRAAAFEGGRSSGDDPFTLSFFPPFESGKVSKVLLTVLTI